MARQQVMVHLTAAQALRCEKSGEHLWPAEKLSVEEISRLLLLDHLLRAESERGMVESVRTICRALKRGKIPIDSHHAGE